MMSITKSSIMLGLLAVCAAPVFANHVDTAVVNASCTSYTINLTASALNSGD